MDDFITWVKEQLKKRDWSNNELGRQMNMSSSAVSLVLTRQRQPTWEFCAKLAQALKESPVYVFRRAQLLISVPENQQNEEQALHFFQKLSSENQVAAIAMLRGLAETHAPTLEEQQVLQAFRGLQARERKAITGMLEALGKEQGD